MTVDASSIHVGSGWTIEALDTPPTPPLRVGLDLDGCFFDFGRSYFDGCRALGVIDGEARYVEPTRFEFYEDAPFKQTGRVFTETCDWLADLGMLWHGPMWDDSRNTWEQLTGDHEERFEVHVMTNRAYGTHKAVSEVSTRLWLTHHQLHADSVTFTADKTVVPVDIMLEDQIGNFRALQAAGVEAWLIDRPWNQGEDVGGFRLYNHEEFLIRARAMHSRRLRAAA